MNKTLMPYFEYCRCNGLTLVEVVAGLLLLSTLLVGILTAYGKHVRQIKRAQQKIEAVALADRLLTDWLKKPGQNIPLGNSFSNTKEKNNNDDTRLTWRTYTQENIELQKTLGVKIVRLEISASSRKEIDVLTTIEVLVPVTLSNNGHNQSDETIKTANKFVDIPDGHDAG